MCCRSALGVRMESTDSPPDLKTLRHSLSPKMLSTTKDPEIETRISGSASFKTAKIQKAHKAMRKQIVGQLLRRPDRAASSRRRLPRQHRRRLPRQQGLQRFHLR